MFPWSFGGWFTVNADCTPFSAKISKVGGNDVLSRIWCLGHQGMSSELKWIDDTFFEYGIYILFHVSPWCPGHHLGQNILSYVAGIRYKWISYKQVQTAWGGWHISTVKWFTLFWGLLVTFQWCVCALLPFARNSFVPNLPRFSQGVMSRIMGHQSSHPMF